MTIIHQLQIFKYLSEPYYGDYMSVIETNVYCLNILSADNNFMSNLHKNLSILKQKGYKNEISNEKLVLEIKPFVSTEIVHLTVESCVITINDNVFRLSPKIVSVNVKNIDEYFLYVFSVDFSDFLSHMHRFLKQENN